MELGESLSSTPTWAVAIVTAVLIVLSLLIEHSLHILTHFVERRKRKSLNQALCQIKAEMRNLGFISLLLTMAQQPISKICISVSSADTFLPCKDRPLTPAISADDGIEDVNTCIKKGKLPLMSPDGTLQLQVLIFMLAIFHVVSSLLTLGLAEIKTKNWGTWEEEAHTLEYQLSNDPRRFKLAKQTSFGRRHLKFWSNHWSLLWIVCFVRQFTNSVSRADYFALRNGYIDTHLGPKSVYNFHKFLRRSLDKDFKELVTISPSIWTAVILFIFFNADVFNNHYWLPFIPLVVLLAIGTKLEVIITNMCLESNKNRVIVSGEVYVNPNDELFWFGQPRWLLLAIRFILIQNSFQLAFVIWSWYKYGFNNCFHREIHDSVFSFAGSILVQFLCAYVTLPLYSLVNQMGSTMRETIFTDRVVTGLKNWHVMAKRNLSFMESNTGNSTPTTPSRSHSISANSHQPLMSSPRAAQTSLWTHPPSPSFITSTITPAAPTYPVPTTQNKPSRSGASTSSGSRAWNGGTTAFEFPTRRRELEEIQKVTEEMMVTSGRRGGFEGGEMSFRMWWKQEMISPIGARRTS
ncbi:MLO-like protein 2 [Phalaenopsis equestris]|uniref:MLO-like protein 2 n=1 Tax=Phalaenopsis equestris TaxID=78828 RepID=UPI0009E2ADBA|nr:MLO-like protein 2 [Phalaenopsis equestris]